MTDQIIDNLPLHDEAFQLWNWQHGGTSFYCQLYSLFRKADSDNKMRLAAAFPHHARALHEWDLAGDGGNDFFRKYKIIE